MAEANYPKYYYDPRTQQYTLLNPVNPTPEESAGLAALQDQMSYGGGDGSSSGPGSSGPGSGGVGGDVGLGLMGYSEATMGMAPGAAVAGVVGNALADQAIAQAVATNEALATMESQAVPSVTTMGVFGPVANPAYAVDIAPVANPEAQVAALTAMNAQQQAEADEDAAVASNADTVADAVAEAQAATDSAEAAAAPAATSEGTEGSSNSNSSSDANAGPDGVGQGPGPGDGSSGEGGGGEGEKAGGVINLKKYQLGGSVMGMGDSAPQYAYGPLMMAGGGLAAAQQAQSKGRGQDTMLVHMTPKEVAGLQALAMSRGGSLTINPQTGLPEAGFLSSLLPMAIGAAITATTGIPAWQAGLLVGGGTALATGSLGRGLMAGLGAFGGAGIGDALVSAGSAAAAGTPANLANYGAGFDVLGEVATPTLPGASTVPITSTPSYQEALMASGNPEVAARTAGMSQQLALPKGFDSATAFDASNVVPETYTPSTKDLTYADYPAIKTPQTMTMGERLESAGRGITGLGNEAGRDRFMTSIGGGKGLMQYGLPAASGVVSDIMAPKPLNLGAQSKPQIRPYQLNVENLSAQNAPLYTPTSTQERDMVRYAYTPMPAYRAAEGGEVPSSYDIDVDGVEETYEEGGIAKLAKMRKSLKGTPYYKFSQDRKDSSMEAGIEQNFAAGGSLPPRFLSGGGDGMSDSIKANIDGKQEARLADGEFVVPADVVSHLGNGSSKAGAKKLYSMMDRIRKARTGQKRQAPEVEAEGYMPA